MEDALAEKEPWFADRRMSLDIDMVAHRGDFERKRFPKPEKWHDAVIDRLMYKEELENFFGGEVVYELVECY
jgi:hypothetical protein